MADFCKQCSEDLFSKDYGDMKGLITEERFKEGYSAYVICEGCGGTFVDHEGRCISKDCMKMGHEECQ